jgi:gluconate:H+ symporter, GntP family
MIEGPLLIAVLLLAVGLIILSTAKLRLHPFLALIAAAFLVGLLVGMPLTDLAEAVTGGFGEAERGQSKVS